MSDRLKQDTILHSQAILPYLLVRVAIASVVFGTQAAVILASEDSGNKFYAN
ncbi:MAG: hypothetical protein NWQ28_12165 [Nodularia sp. (in: cyanobacteria)]|nr:hypothetical protein [Nodularia sp. (in: cyanobacteria)]